MSDNLNTLMELKNKMESEDTALAVSESRIESPAREVENALTGFVVSRLERLETDAQFGDLVKMHIRQRLPEFSVDQLLQLNDQVSKNNNRSVEGMVPLFQGDTGGKNITDRMKDTSVSSAAQNLYNTADRDVLQAVSYLSSVMARMGAANGVVADEKD